MQCDIVPLKGALKLAEGIFMPTMNWVLQDLIRTQGSLGLQANYPAPNRSMSSNNVALSFAGNPQLTSHSSKAGGIPASIILERDAILNGQLTMFSGFDRLKTLCWLVMPAGAARTVFPLSHCVISLSCRRPCRKCTFFSFHNSLSVQLG